jgi:lysozyme family protein
MASFAEYKNAYENNWANLEIRPNRLQEARNQANRLLHGKPAYQQIEAKSGVPWWFVGLCHYRESNFKQLYDAAVPCPHGLGRAWQD